MFCMFAMFAWHMFATSIVSETAMRFTTFPSARLGMWSEGCDGRGCFRSFPGGAGVRDCLVWLTAPWPMTEHRAAWLCNQTKPSSENLRCWGTLTALNQGFWCESLCFWCWTSSAETGCTVAIWFLQMLHVLAVTSCSVRLVAKSASLCICHRHQPQYWCLGDRLDRAKGLHCGLESCFTPCHGNPRAVPWDVLSCACLSSWGGVWPWSWSEQLLSSSPLGPTGGREVLSTYS